MSELEVRERGGMGIHRSLKNSRPEAMRVRTPPLSSEDDLLEQLWLERHSLDGETAYCPKCRKTRKFKRYRTRQSRRSWTCTACGHHIHPTAGTVFEKSSMPLSDWAHVVAVVRDSDDGHVNAKQVERHLHCNYKTARRMIASARTYLSEDFCACGCGEKLSRINLQAKAGARLGLTPYGTGRRFGREPQHIRQVFKNQVAFVSGHWHRSPAGREWGEKLGDFLHATPGLIAWNAEQKRQGTLREAERSAGKERRRVQRELDKERRRALSAARWWDRKRVEVSLDAAPFAGEGVEMYERVVTDRVEDPASLAIRDYEAETLRQIVGDMSPEDVERMTAWDLERLRGRLAAAGLAPAGVQVQERERLQAPVRHAGETIKKVPSIPGKKKRREKVAHKAANRARGNSNRPSQKPRDDVRDLRRLRQRERDEA